MSSQGHKAQGVGRIWFVRIRGWKAWFAKGASGYLLGPYRSLTDTEAALDEDSEAVMTGELDHAEAERNGNDLTSKFDEGDFPNQAACIEDFDGDAMWCVWLLQMRSGVALYFVDTPEGPLPDIYYDRRRCPRAVIAPKAHWDRNRRAINAT